MVDQIDPTIRYLIVCENVAVDPENERRVSIIGLFSVIHSLNTPEYPFVQRELCVFLQLTGCRGPGLGRVEIQHADTGGVIFQTRTRRLQLDNDPLEIVGLSFRIQNLRIPEAGLYWFQFWYNDRMVAQQPVIFR